jgi:hypothetical protein
VLKVRKVKKETQAIQGKMERLVHKVQWVFKEPRENVERLAPKDR